MRCINAPVSSIKSRIEEVLDLVSMKGMGGRLPTELSGGEQQRAAYCPCHRQQAFADNCG